MTSRLVNTKSMSSEPDRRHPMQISGLILVMLSVFAIVAVFAVNRFFSRSPAPPVAAKAAESSSEPVFNAPVVSPQAEVPPLVPCPNVRPDPSIADYANAPSEVILQAAKYSIADEQARHMRDEARENARLPSDERSTLTPKEATIRAVQDGRIMLQ